MKTNAIKTAPKARTHEGAPSPKLSAVRELRRTVMAHMLFEDTFYESGEDSAKRIMLLVSKVPFVEAAQIAVEAREKMKLRHAPLYVVREMIRCHKNIGKPMGDLIARVIQRPDEIGELMALYWKDGNDQPLTAQMKIGLARALKKFPEYALAKHDNGGVKLRDALFLVHARPRQSELKELKHAHDVPAIRRKDYRRGIVARHDTHVFTKLTRKTLATPDTWEVGLSEGGDKKATFTRLIQEKKLGALALLRNLRNMLQAGVDTDLIRQGLMSMQTERVLPFRFITAARYAPQLEDALEEAMFKCLAAVEKLPGKTVLLIDHSGSMNDRLSTKSELTRFDAALGLAMILREKAQRCRIACFSDAGVEVPPRRGFALAQAARDCMRFGGTRLGEAIEWVYREAPETERLIVITDEQSADKPPQPKGKGYIINCASYKQGVGYGSWITVNGFSESVFDFIRAYEADEDR